MPNVTLANTTANLSGKTVLTAENPYTITGSYTFGANLLFTDATYDIGASGATRPRDGWFSRDLAIGRNLTVTGGQIVFPGTQSAASNVNTLDDYEEGSYSPIIGGDGGTSGQSYTTQVGRYTKIGNLVHVQGIVTLSAKGTITGNAMLGALPFTTQNTTSLNGAIHIGYFQNMGTSFVTVSCYIVPNTTYGLLVAATGAATSLSALSTTNIADTTQLIFGGTYQTAT